MKKLLLGLVCGIMIVTAVACSSNNTQQESQVESVEGVPTNNMEQAPTGGASDKVPDPNVEPVEIVAIYSVDGDNLKKTMGEADELDAQEIADLLIEAGVLAEGTTVVSFETEGEGSTAVGPGVSEDDVQAGTGGSNGILNLSAAPVNTNSLTLAAIGNTFIENFELDQLELQVNGQNISGGSGFLTYFN